jgi:hypothetical protein
MNTLQNQKPEKNNKFKFAKTVLLTSLLFSAFITMSANIPGTKPGSHESEKTIQNYFKFPQILLPHAESNTSVSKRVEVLFTTDKNGKVNFAIAKTEDVALKDEVEKQFYKLLLPKLPAEVVHSVVLNFKTMQ